jgi:hypothetical protein
MPTVAQAFTPAEFLKVPSRCGYGREIGPPVQRSAHRPLNVELLQALEGRSGNWAALQSFETVIARLSGRRSVLVRSSAPVDPTRHLAR